MVWDLRCGAGGVVEGFEARKWRSEGGVEDTKAMT